jgi:hypothetical protein
VPRLANYTLAFALQLREKHGKTSVRVAMMMTMFKGKEQRRGERCGRLLVELNHVKCVHFGIRKEPKQLTSAQGVLQHRLRSKAKTARGVARNHSNKFSVVCLLLYDASAYVTIFSPSLYSTRTGILAD